MSTPGPLGSLPNPQSGSGGPVPGGAKATPVSVGCHPNDHGALVMVYTCWAEGARATEESLVRVLQRKFDAGVATLNIQESLFGHEIKEAAAKAQAYLNNLIEKIKNAADWESLNKLAEPILGPVPTIAGEVFGVIESLGKDVLSLLSLGKLLVLGGMYERIKNYSGTLILDPSSLALALTIRAVPALWEEARRCNEALWGAYYDLLKIAENRGEFKAFIEKVGKSIWKGVEDDWNKLQSYSLQSTVSGNFEAGRIIGHALYQVIMMLLLVFAVLETIASKFSWLVRVTRFAKTGEIAELGEVAEGAKTAEGVAEGVKGAETAEGAAPKPKVSEPVDEPTPPSGDDAAAPSTKVKQKSLREQYLGRTPGKNSRTGLEVQERMAEEGTLRTNTFTGETEFQGSDGEWYPLDEADMSHKTDAVKWWNETGRSYGAKSPEVRDWMLDSDNYTLDHYSINRSAGAKLPDRYLPPLQ